jgi:hypothetical protein
MIDPTSQAGGSWNAAAPRTVGARKEGSLTKRQLLLVSRIAYLGCSLLAFVLTACAEAQREIAAGLPATTLQVALATEQGSRPVLRVEERLEVHLRTGADVYAYCFYADSDGRVSRVFPNRFQPNALVRAGRKVTIPGIGAGFEIVPEKPDTSEEIRCFVAERDPAPALPAALISIDLAPLPADSLLDVAGAFRRAGRAVVEVGLPIQVVGEDHITARLNRRSQRERNVFLIRPEAKAIMAAITQQESSGNYRAIGPPTKYGRAYGRYQVLDQNIPKWTERALGYSMTPNEFRNNPKAQDLTAGYIITIELKRLKYSTRDMIAVWFTGDPYEGNSQCDSNMCVKEYVRLAEAELAKLKKYK